MGNSLFDQLKQAGLVDEKKANKLKQEQRKKGKQHKGKKACITDENKLRAQRVLAEKAARDRELNKERNKAAGRKAVAAQINQLIEMNRVADRDGEIAFNFTDDGKVQRIYVSEKIHQQLGRGYLAVVRYVDRYELVPAPVAERIKLRDESRILVCNTPNADAIDDDDPYADYKVPDDLMW